MDELLENPPTFSPPPATCVAFLVTFYGPREGAGHFAFGSV